MKTLKGLKNSISSFENNKLANLETINGGLAQETTIVSSTATEPSANCSDRTDNLDSGKSRTITICI